ncbi:hypothetical protein QBC39DRAFT_348312 [Podospora conica]|nr:hypothetical protein QBC39DRAFT_348312 [Schizothecium conicum]
MDDGRPSRSRPAEPPLYFHMEQAPKHPTTLLQADEFPYRPQTHPGSCFSSQSHHIPHQHVGPQPNARREEKTSTARIKQADTRPISQEQLVAEVKGIYAGLVMVEDKCIEVDVAKTNPRQQWHALIAVPRALLHEHHDFFLSFQHPSASPSPPHEHRDFFLASQHPFPSPGVRRLASKYAMPARMWRHGIHTFLELLWRHGIHTVLELLHRGLPVSLAHMLTFTVYHEHSMMEHKLAFIYPAYSMMALLYETVPAFENTWIECLGDLDGYRMAIEDDNVRDRTDASSHRMAIEDDNVSVGDAWTEVGSEWCNKASDRLPTTGRLYHHLAILARPKAMQQLFYYNKALCVAITFVSARESIMTLFDPVMAVDSNSGWQPRRPSTEHAFVKTQEVMFASERVDKLSKQLDEFMATLDSHIGHSKPRLLEPGYHMAISNCCAVLGYGSTSNPIRSLINQTRTHKPETGIGDAAAVHISRPWRDLDRRTDLPIGLRHIGLIANPSNPSEGVPPASSALNGVHSHNKRLHGHRVNNPPLWNLRSGVISRILRLFIPLFGISVVLAGDPWYLHVPKVLLLGVSAMGSFGTGMASLNLDMADPARGDGPAHMSLRIAASLLVGILAVGYSFWFLLSHARKTRRFISGMFCASVFWLIVRLVRGSSDRDKTSGGGSDYIWLDELNLLGCVATVVGILNAQRSMFSPAEAEEDDEPGDLRDTRGDVESQEEGRRLNARRDEDGAGGRLMGLMEIGTSSVSAVSQVAGA